MHESGDVKSADALSDQEVISEIAEVIDAENRSAARKYSLFAQFSRRGLNLKLDHSSPAHWLATGTRIAHGNAARQFGAAEWLTTRPTVFDALAGGDIHAAHVKEIFDGYNHISTAHTTLDTEQIADAVAELLAVAMARNAHDVKVRAQEIAHTFEEQARARYEKARREQDEREQARRDKDKRKQQEPGDSVPDDDAYGDVDGDADGVPVPPLGPPPTPVSENAALNTLQMYLQANGRTTFHGDFDKLLAEKLRSAVAELSRPTPEPDGTRDPRSAPKRNADALSRILDKYSGATSHGAPARVNVTVNLRDLLAGGAFDMCDRDMSDLDWPFYLTWTGPISSSLARVLGCDADLNPIILDDNGIPLAMGRTVRLATPEQRAAVTVRDRCCVKCGKAAQFCEVHHIVFWDLGGHTDITNLALVCGDCHHDIHNRGWEMAIGDDGHPFVIPPATFDPERKPLLSYHRRRQRPA